MKIFRPIWAELDCGNLISNMALIRNTVGPSVNVMCVVKADAYGHGAAQSARVFQAAGVNLLGVASLEEGMQLRESGITADIMILGYTLPEWASKVVEGGFIQTVYHLGLANELDKEARRLEKPCRVHIKIDTGMGRIGVMPEKALYLIKEIASKPALKLDGIFSHLSSADVLDSDYTDYQLKRFSELLDKLKAAGISVPNIHFANSAGIMRFPQSHYNIVRPGILLYGLYPSAAMKGDHGFKPVMNIKTNIIEIKTVPKGSRISYGGNFTAERPTRIATMPAGYADGFSRRLSNVGHVLVQGRRAPIIGNVCMDFMMADVTDVPEVKIDDEVVLIGKQGSQEIHFDELAAHLGTINYEAVTLIGKRVPRVYLNYAIGNPAEL